MSQPRTAVLKLALFGSVVGLAWTSALRGYMAELVGPSSRVEWVATFTQILLPGVLVGVLLGIAEHFRRTGGRRGWRWLAAAPVLLVLAPQLTPGAFLTLITTGLGGGAVAVTLIGLLGGFAVSGRGPLWGRILGGVLALALTVGAALATSVFDERRLALSEPRGVWVALLFASLMVVFAFACSIPHRTVSTGAPA